ncbi:MAG: radical SAM protein [Nitrospinota bacterium]|nr:radical SAM protein [Nitrospinota bacterium]
MLSQFSGITPLERTVSTLLGSGIFSDVIIIAGDQQHSRYYAEVSRKTGAKLYIGDSDNLNFRMRNALMENRYTEGNITRVNAENIFTLPLLLKTALDSHVESSAQYTFHSGAPGGLAPDIVSISALKAIKDPGTPYYRSFRRADSGVAVNKIETGLNMEKTSFSALDYVSPILFEHLSKDLISIGIEDFLMRSREILKALMKNPSSAGVREINKKLNSIETGLKLEHLHSMPVYLRVGVSSPCNLKCTTCTQQFTSFTEEEFNKTFGIGYRFWDTTFKRTANGKYKKRGDYLTPEAFKRIENLFFPYLSYCSFGLHGEPLLNKHLPDYIETAKRHGIDTGLITNGTLLNEKVSRKLASGILNNINISFDGAKKETFEKVRKGSYFDQVKRNISELSGMRESGRGSLPAISLAVTISTVNFRELPELVKIAPDIGADSIFVNYASTAPFMNREESLFGRMGEVSDIFEKTLEQAELSGIPVDLPRTTGKAEVPDNFCSIPWEQSSIFIGGRATPCCLIAHKQDVAENDFQPVWNGDFYKNLRLSHAGKLPLIENCKNCADEKLRDVSNPSSFFLSAKSNPC